MKLVIKITMAIKARKPNNQRYHVRAVERALILLRFFVDCDDGFSATEISHRAQLDLSTTFRLLVTLQAQGFIDQHPDSGRYHLGVTCLELGSQYLKTNDVRKRALNVMEELRNDFGETVHLAMLEGNEVVYLEKLPGLHPIGLMSSRVGQHSPAHCTGVGKALVAFLPDGELRRLFPRAKLARYTDTTITDLNALVQELADVRERGYAIDDQEHEIGVKCAAVPIFNHKGIVAAMSISGPAERMDQHITKGRLVEKLLQAGSQVSSQVGGARRASRPDENRVRSSALR